MMMLERDRVGELLASLRRVSGDYTPPESACFSYRELYRRLAELAAARTSTSRTTSISRCQRPTRSKMRRESPRLSRRRVDTAPAAITDAHRVRDNAVFGSASGSASCCLPEVARSKRKLTWTWELKPEQKQTSRRDSRGPT